MLIEKNDKEAFSTHATAIMLDGLGYLLRAPSGAGKSSLALQVLKAGGVLIADDQCLLHAENNTLIAKCPPAIKNKLEVRGIGVIMVNGIDQYPLNAIINLRPSDQIERLPHYRTESLCDVELPVFDIDARCPSALARLQVIGDILRNTASLEAKECA